MYIIYTQCLYQVEITIQSKGGKPSPVGVIVIANSSKGFRTFITMMCCFQCTLCNTFIFITVQMCLSSVLSKVNTYVIWQDFCVQVYNVYYLPVSKPLFLTFVPTIAK